MHVSTLNDFKRSALAMVGALMLFVSLSATAQDENPWKAGNYWNVSGIHVKDGGGLKYAQYLATEWVRNQEYAKSQGWISDFMVLSNTHPREGEPNLYLITISASLPSSARRDSARLMLPGPFSPTWTSMARPSLPRTALARQYRANSASSDEMRAPKFG